MPIAMFPGMSFPFPLQIFSLVVIVAVIAAVLTLRAIRRDPNLTLSFKITQLFLTTLIVGLFCFFISALVTVVFGLHDRNGEVAQIFQDGYGIEVSSKDIDAAVSEGKRVDNAAAVALDGKKESLTLTPSLDGKKIILVDNQGEIITPGMVKAGSRE